MKDVELQNLKHWFESYTSGFLNGSQEQQDGIKMKITHILCVCLEVQEMGQYHGLSGEDLVLLEACALFHDIGRLEQFAKYGTYSDKDSENHALLGLKVIDDTAVIDHLKVEEVQIIKAVVAGHNAISIPEDLDSKTKLLLKMLRDADKLDIWRVMVEHYENPDDGGNSCVVLGFPDEPEISDMVCEALLAENLVNFADMHSLSDFKLMQMGWVFDLNFKYSFQQLKKRGYMEKIRSVLPDNSKVKMVCSKIQGFVEKNSA